MTTTAAAPAAARPVVAPERYIEDHRVGETLVSEPFTFTRELVAGFADLVHDHSEVHDPDVPGTSVHGSLVISGVIAWFVREGYAAQVRAELDHTWHYDKPVLIGEPVTFRMTFTRVARTAGLTHGVVHRTIEVRDEQGEVLQHATSRILVRAREARDDTAERAGRALGTPAWAALLGERLGQDEEFTRLTSTWDGSIGLAVGETLTQLRVYKGRVLEATRRTPHGPTFTVHASEQTWTELVTGEANDYTRRAMSGQISMTGDAYEYLRLNRTVVAVVDVMRQLAEEEK